MSNPYLDIIIRSLCVYLFMIFGIRLFGKTQLSQLNAGDVVLLLLISNAVQNAMVGENTSLEGGILAALVLFIANYALKNFVFRNKKIQKLLKDDPVILIKDGKIIQENVDRVDVTDEELEEAIREHGVENEKEVKLAILETDGNISIVSADKITQKTQYSNHKRKKLRRRLI